MAQQVKNPPAMQETQVVDHKFMCQIQSEARQTKMLQFGAERGLLQGQGRRRMACAKKPLNSLMVLREEYLFEVFFFFLNLFIWVHQILVEARGIFIAAWELSHHA